MSLSRYRYTGDLGILQGQTALGRDDHLGFRVQVDDFHHIWSHRWHKTNPDHWERISDYEPIIIDGRWALEAETDPAVREMSVAKGCRSFEDTARLFPRIARTPPLHDQQQPGNGVS